MKNRIIKFGVIIVSVFLLLAGNTLLFDLKYIESEKEESIQIEEYADNGHVRKISSSFDANYVLTPSLFYSGEIIIILHQSFPFTAKCERSPPCLQHFFFL